MGIVTGSISLFCGENEVFGPKAAESMVGGTTKYGWKVLSAVLISPKEMRLEIETEWSHDA